MQSRLIMLFALLAVPCPLMAQSSPRNKTVTLSNDTRPLKAVVADIARQTGLEIDISAMDAELPLRDGANKQPFWTVVDRLAEQVNSRVVIGRQGVPVRLMPSTVKDRPPVSVDGPFRIAATSVDARIDLTTGKTVYDLVLEVAWEATLPVYRIDTVPAISKGTDDAGRNVTVQPIESRLPVSGVSAYLRLRLEGLSRQSQSIAILQGTFKATIADEMLRTRFDIAKGPMKVRQAGVDIDLTRFEWKKNAWVADIQLHYPQGGAEFESFETYWLSRNRLTLIAPDGKTRVTVDDPEINGTSLRYTIKAPGNLAGWTMEYETPAPMREVPVAFTLKGIALP